MSAIPSHSLSVFHHSISKPDPHVNSIPPPRQTEPITTCSDGIPNMQLFDPPFAEPNAQYCVGRLGLSQKQTWADTFDSPLFNVIFQPAISPSISISFPQSAIQPLCARIVGHSAGNAGRTSQSLFANLQSDRALSPAEK